MSKFVTIGIELGLAPSIIRSIRLGIEDWRVARDRLIEAGDKAAGFVHYPFGTDGSGGCLGYAIAARRQGHANTAEAFREHGDSEIGERFTRVFLMEAHREGGPRLVDLGCSDGRSAWLQWIERKIAQLEEHEAPSTPVPAPPEWEPKPKVDEPEAVMISS